MPLSPKIQAYLTQGAITLEQAMGLDLGGRITIESEAISGLIADGILTLEQAMGLSLSGRVNLESAAISDLIEAGILTLEEAIGLSLDERLSLESEAICSLIEEGKLTFGEAMGLNLSGRLNLESEAVRGLISDGILTLEQAMGLNLYECVNLESEPVRALIADRTLTLEQAMGLNYEGRTALNNEYTRQRLRTGDLTIQHIMDGLITTITGVINALPSDDPQNQAAQRYVEGLAASEQVYTDLTSGVNTHKLLALSWLAALKFPIVVNEEVKHYLAHKANPATFSEFTQFTHQIKQIEKEGVDVIWGSIKDQVATRMFDEFGSLYVNQDDPGFTTFMNTGKHVKLEELPSFQKELSESEGYRKQCGSWMHSFEFFSSSEPQNPEPNLLSNETGTLKL